MVWLLPLGCFAALLLAGVVAVHYKLDWLVWILAVGLGLLAVWALMKGQQMQGWDGIGYAIAALLVAAPAGLGVLAGGAIGWWRRKRRSDAAS